MIINKFCKRIMKIIHILIPCENQYNSENHGIPFENHENHENHRIQKQLYKIYENLLISLDN